MAQKPKAIRPGDRIGIVAPASAPNDPNRLDIGMEGFRQLGFEPVVAPNGRKKLGFLGGTDQERADDIHTMFSDPTIAGIVCARGGYGTTRMVDLLDPEIIAKNPKVFVGYSDISTLSAFFYEQCDLVSFYGPMIAVEFAKGPTPFVQESFLRMLTRPEPYGPIGAPEGWTLKKTLVGGKVSGEIAGGCLCLFESVLGTPFEVKMRDKIFFFEDIDAEPYQMDRSLTHLLYAGFFEGVRGIAIGECAGCEHVEGRSGYDNCQSLEDVIRDRLEPLGVPIVMGLPFGHGTEKATLPYGVQATLDADACELIVTEPAVV